MSGADGSQPAGASAEGLAEDSVGILLVDDNPANLVAIEAVLAPLGQRLVTARSGEEALRHVLDESFALILMDAEMPGMDGFQTAALIKQRERTRDIPLIFVSAVHRSVGDATNGYAIGAADYILKPFDPDHLRAKIRSLLSEHRRRERLQARTRQLLAEEQRSVRAQAARATAETANRLKDDFVSMVSHELRTPLQAILGWAALLRSGNISPERVQKAHEAIYRSAVLQARLVDDLLDLSRTESGKLRLKLQTVDVAEPALRAVQGLAEWIRNRGVFLDISLEPCLASCDADRMEQVVSNLVTNAVKFSPAGGRVRVALKASPASYEILVEDQGIGLAPDTLRHIFEPFWQAQETSLDRGRGLGLGLSIVRELVELHGGGITAQSDGIGRGASFKLVLPRRLESDDTPRSAAADFADGAYPSLSGMKVLVVDGDVDNRDLVMTVIEELGGVAQVAESISGALAELRGGSHDVLVSALTLPVETGYALMKKVRAEAAPISRMHAIAVTAHGDDAIHARALRAGFDEVLRKPFGPSALAAAILRRRAPAES